MKERQSAHLYTVEAPIKRKTMKARQNVSSSIEETVRTDSTSKRGVSQPTAETIHEASGRHLLLTLRECAPGMLNDELKLRELTFEACRSTGATVLEVCSYKFAPQGVTALAMLAESHASLHTYPESNLVFWDCFTCGTSCDPELSVAVLVKGLKAKVVSQQVVTRS